MMVPNEDCDSATTSNSDENQASPAASCHFSDSASASSVVSMQSTKSTLKRKNVDYEDEEVVEAKLKPTEDSNHQQQHKIKTRSQTARALNTVSKSTTKPSLSLKSVITSHQTTNLINQPTKSSISDVTLYNSHINPGDKETPTSQALSIPDDDQATEAWLNTFKEWNNKNKLNALEQILEICEHTHIKHVHNFIEPKLQRDYISEMPKELILLLLTYVRPKDLYKLAQVSHYWHLIANDTILWKNICKRNRIDLDNLNNNTSMILNEFKENNFGKFKADDGEESSKTQTCEATTSSRTESDQDPTSETDPTSSDTPNPIHISTKQPTTACYSSPSSPSSSSLSSESNNPKPSISKPSNPSTDKPSRPHRCSKSTTNSSTRTTSLSSSSKKRKNNSHSKFTKQPARSIISTSLPYFNNTISDRTLLSCHALLSLVKTPLNQHLESFNPYKRAYLIDYNVTKNWCQRPLPKPYVLRSHDEHVITCLKFDGFRVVSGSDDCTLKVWCALTGKLLQTLVGHTGGVWASQLKDNIVISGSTDRSVRVWNIDTGECIHVLTGHTSTVRCLALHGSIVISGSRDSLLRVWNIETGQCMQILRGHVAAVRCVCFDGRYVVSGSYDFTIRVWCPFKNECVHVLEGHSNRVYSLLFEGDRIVSGSLDTTIIVWNVHTGTIIHKLIGHQSLTSGMQIKNDILVSGNADSTVKIWSLNTGECLHTLAGNNKHMSAVTCLSFNEKFVVSSSDDGTVKLWNVETGEFIRNLLGLDSGGRGGVVWRISMHKNKLVCAVGSRIGVEETKLILLDFDWPPLDLTEKIQPVIKSEENTEVDNNIHNHLPEEPQTEAVAVHSGHVLV